MAYSAWLTATHQAAAGALIALLFSAAHANEPQIYGLHEHVALQELAIKL